MSADKPHRSALRLIQSAASAASAVRYAVEQQEERNNKVAGAPRSEVQHRSSATTEYLERMAARHIHGRTSEIRSQDSSHWDTIGASELKQALVDTVMVDAAWLAALAESAEILPRCQEVPQQAIVRLDEMEAWSLTNNAADQTVGALIVSYPWLDVNHPDPFGEQLRRMAFVFRAFAGSAQMRKGCRVGVFGTTARCHRDGAMATTTGPQKSMLASGARSSASTRGTATGTRTCCS